LGRTVLVDQDRLGRVLPPEGDVLRPELLSTDDEGSRSPCSIPGTHLFAEPMEMSRSDLHQAVVARAPECLAQLLDAQLFVEQVNAPAGDQGGEQGGDRQVE